MTQNIGFLGVNGSYSHQAAKKLLPDFNAVGLNSFEEIIKSVETAKIQRCVIPIENSSSGRIPEVHRLLSTMELYITAEYLLPINHALVASSPTDINEIHTLYSHPQGFIQTSRFLSERFPNVTRKTTSDTATAVKHVTSTGDRGIAAIGSEFAAELYGGTAIHTNISDRSDNLTRFVLLSDEAVYSSNNNMTSLIIQVSHQPGALVSALSVFGAHDVNITKLETYMISDTTKLPTFYLDLGCGSRDARLVNAMEDIQAHISYFKFLGSYQADSERTGLNGFLKP